MGSVKRVLAALAAAFWLLAAAEVASGQAVGPPASSIWVVDSEDSAVEQPGTELRIRSAAGPLETVPQRGEEQPVGRAGPEQGTTVRLVDADPQLRHLGTGFRDSGGMVELGPGRTQTVAKRVGPLVFRPATGKQVLPGRAAEMFVGPHFRRDSNPPQWGQSVAPDDTLRVVGERMRPAGPPKRAAGQLPRASRIRASRIRVIDTGDPRQAVRAVSFRAQPQRIGPLQVVADDVAELTVGLSRNKLLRSEVDVIRTSVGDPGLCEVVRYSPREVLISGRSQGATRATFWFADGRHPPVTCVVRVVGDRGASRLDYPGR